MKTNKGVGIFSYLCLDVEEGKVREKFQLKSFQNGLVFCAFVCAN